MSKSDPMPPKKGKKKPSVAAPTTRASHVREERKGRKYSAAQTRGRAVYSASGRHRDRSLSRSGYSRSAYTDRSRSPSFKRTVKLSPSPPRRAQPPKQQPLRPRRHRPPTTRDESGSRSATPPQRPPLRSRRYTGEEAANSTTGDSESHTPIEEGPGDDKNAWVVSPFKRSAVYRPPALQTDQSIQWGMRVANVQMYDVGMRESFDALKSGLGSSSMASPETKTKDMELDTRLFTEDSAWVSLPPPSTRQTVSTTTTTTVATATTTSIHHHHPRSHSVKPEPASARWDQQFAMQWDHQLATRWDQQFMTCLQKLLRDTFDVVKIVRGYISTLRTHGRVQLAPAFSQWKLRVPSIKYHAKSRGWMLQVGLVKSLADDYESPTFLCRTQLVLWNTERSEIEPILTVLGTRAWDDTNDRFAINDRTGDTYINATFDAIHVRMWDSRQVYRLPMYIPGHRLSVLSICFYRSNLFYLTTCGLWKVSIKDTQCCSSKLCSFEPPILTLDPRDIHRGDVTMFGLSNENALLIQIRYRQSNICPLFLRVPLVPIGPAWTPIATTAATTAAVPLVTTATTMRESLVAAQFSDGTLNAAMTGFNSLSVDYLHASRAWIDAASFGTIARLHGVDAAIKFDLAARLNAGHTREWVLGVVQTPLVFVAPYNNLSPFLAGNHQAARCMCVANGKYIWQYLQAFDESMYLSTAEGADMLAVCDDKMQHMCELRDVHADLPLRDTHCAAIDPTTNELYFVTDGGYLQSLALA